MLGATTHIRVNLLQACEDVNQYGPASSDETCDLQRYMKGVADKM